MFVHDLFAFAGEISPKLPKFADIDSRVSS